MNAVDPYRALILTTYTVFGTMAASVAVIAALFASTWVDYAAATIAIGLAALPILDAVRNTRLWREAMSA
jgi:hypothetical protein